jgi:hypothetical protein
MSDAETSAYLLMAGGLIWVLVGIIGLRKRRTDFSPAELESLMTDDNSDRS